ncbi:MAG: segregation/condensation protein A [Zetaproteobacteria bacterium]|nr:segregation/condensation protein A [Zetaproteobacteria bacterium]
MTPYFLKLEQFEGPLDLLIHLVRVHELDIFSIDLTILTEQYIAHLRIMEFKDLKDAAAFMDMAATLIGLKTKQLLPRNHSSINTDDETGEEEWTEEKLSERLQLYERFRGAGEHFRERMAGAFSSIHVGNHAWQAYTQTYGSLLQPLKGQVETLTILYEQMLTELTDRRPVTVKAVQESLTVDEVIQRLKDSIEKMNCILLEQLYTKIESRYELVAHVLASLQLVRDRLAKIHQEEHFGPLWIYDTNAQWDNLTPPSPEGKS